MTTTAWVGVGIVAYAVAGFIRAHGPPDESDDAISGWTAESNPTIVDYVFGCLIAWAPVGWSASIRGFRQRFFDESEDEGESDKMIVTYGTAGPPPHPNAKCATKPSGITFTATSRMPSSSSADLDDVTPRESSDPLVGFRQWRLFELKDGQIALVSSIRPYIYDGPVATTEREDLERGFGLHAAKNGDKFYDPAAHLPVEGEVELFGRVVEGSRGYRAEKLKIKSLTLYPGGWTDKQYDHPSAQLGVGSQFMPDSAVRQFASSELAETPWPHPFESLASRLEDRYRCDVEIGERDGSPILDKSRSNGRPRQTNYHFIQKPTDSEVAEYSTGGEIWTPRDPQENDDETGMFINGGRVQNSTLHIPSGQTLHIQNANVSGVNIQQGGS